VVAVASGLILALTFEESTWDHLRHLDLPTALGLGSLVVATWLFGGARVFTLARGLGYPLSYRRSVAVILSSEFGITVTPAGAGGAALWLGVLKGAGVPVSHGAALLTAELAIDGLFFTFLLPFALVALARRPALVEGVAARVEELWIYPVLGVALVVVLGVLLARLPALTPARRWLWNRRTLRRTVVRVLRLWRDRHLFLHRLRSGLHTLFRVRPGLVAITMALAVMQWTCRYSVLPLLVMRFGGASEVVVLFLIQGVLMMLSYVIVAPGGGGGVEVAAALVLPFFAPAAVIGVVVVLWRFYTYHLFLLAGGSAFALTLTADRRRRAAEDLPVDPPA